MIVELFAMFALGALCGFLLAARTKKKPVDWATPRRLALDALERHGSVYILNGQKSLVEVLEETAREAMRVDREHNPFALMDRVVRIAKKERQLAEKKLGAGEIPDPKIEAMFRGRRDAARLIEMQLEDVMSYYKRP